MKVKQEERKKKTPKRKKKQQQQKRPSRGGPRKSGHKQSYEVNLLELSGQAKDILIKDLEAELRALKKEDRTKDIRILDLEAELRGCQKDDKIKDMRIKNLEGELRGFEAEYKIQNMHIKNLEEDLRIRRQWLMMEQDAKVEAMSRLESYKKKRDKSDAMAMQKDPEELQGKCNNFGELALDSCKTTAQDASEDGSDHYSDPGEE